MNAPLEQRWRISIHRTERWSKMQAIFLLYFSILFCFKNCLFLSSDVISINIKSRLLTHPITLHEYGIMFLLLLLSIKMGKLWLFGKWYTQSRCISLEIGRFWRRLISQCNLIINRTTRISVVKFEVEFWMNIQFLNQITKNTLITDFNEST